VALRWESGGGLRIENNKFNGATQPGFPSTARWQDCIQMVIAPLGATSVMVIAGNSIENFTRYGAHIGRDVFPNTSLLEKITVTGNEWGGFVLNNGSICLFIDGGQSGGIQVATIDGNNFTWADSSIVLKHCEQVGIGHNIHNTVGGNGPNSPVIWLDTQARNVHLTPQTYHHTGAEVELYRNAPGIPANNHASEQTGRTGWSREIPFTTSDVTWVECMRFAVPDYGAGIVDVTFSGNVDGVGAGLRSLKAAYTKATGAVTLTTIGAEVSAGAAFDIRLNTVDISGSVRVQIKRATGIGADVSGRMQMDLTGAVSSVRRVTA
jgi:hypothetical protein